MYLVNRYTYTDAFTVDDDVDGTGPTELVASTQCAQWTDVVRYLRNANDVTANAWDFPPRSLTHQVNNVNGGELLILCAGSGWQGTAVIQGGDTCPYCHTFTEVRPRNTMVDHAPGASDPYS